MQREAIVFSATVPERAFRGSLLDGLSRAGLPIPEGIAEAWVVDCWQFSTCRATSAAASSANTASSTTAMAK